MCLTSFDGFFWWQTVSMPFDLMIVLPPDKNLELASPQSLPATRLDKLVYSPNCYIQIFRLKHIDPLWLAFFKSRLKTALITNILPHIWKLANIIPIPKPNKDIDKGTSYRHISLLSLIAKTLEKSLLPYITANTPTQHGYRTQHSTVTALHTLNNTVAKGFNQMTPPARTITVALDMSKAFKTINRHTLIRKLLQTKIPCTIIRFIANYIKGRKAYTTYRNHTSSQRQFKTGVPQGGFLSPTLFIFTLQIYQHPEHRFRLWPTQMLTDACPDHIYTHRHECSQEIHTTIPT